LRRWRSGKSVGPRGNNPEVPVPNLIVFFVLLGWMVSIPELTDSSNDEMSLCCPHWRSVFSSVFKEHSLSVCTKGSDTDPLQSADAI
jgi:hypothetical protein